MKWFNLKVFRLAAVCFFTCQLFITQTLAQWSTDPTVNNAICTDINRQGACRIVSDGSGGAIITWWDNNLATNDYNIYAQRINSAGVIQWTSRGVAICTNSKHQQNPEITSDGNGGAIIIWFDGRNTKNEIFAQKINSEGVVQWTTDGVSVGTVPTHYQHSSPEVTSDGSGGAIIIWSDWRKDEFNNEDKAAYAQRISSNGIIQWGIGGARLNNISVNGPGSMSIISDGNGGAIAAWDQWVGVYPAGNREIFAQKVNADGTLSWGAGSLTICSATDDQAYPYLAGDGTGGAIIVWQDYRSGSKMNLYAQKVSSGGVIQWAENGIQVSTKTTNYGRHRMVSDGSGGAIITWPSNNVIWTQLINASGLTQWTTDGKAIGSDGINPHIVSDGTNGAIITWDNTSGNILAQRVSPAGTDLWKLGGVDVCKNSMNQWEPDITTDGNGGAIISWNDYRNDANTSTDIYAQQISANGALGIVTGIDDNMILTGGSYKLYQNYPNPFKGVTRIDFKVIIPETISLKVYNITGKEVTTLVNARMEPGDYSVNFNTTGLPAGVYYYSMKAGLEKVTRTLILLE